MKSPNASDSRFTKANVPSQINTTSITHAILYYILEGLIINSIKRNTSLCSCFLILNFSSRYN